MRISARSIIGLLVIVLIGELAISSQPYRGGEWSHAIVTCEEFGITPTDRIDASCGFIRIRSSSTGGPAQIPYLRTFPAVQGRRSKSDLTTLLVEPGGPGRSGISYLADALRSGAIPSSLASEVSLMAIDHKGTGRATPTVVCKTSEDRDWERSHTTIAAASTNFPAAELERRVARSREIAQRCRSVGRNNAPLGATAAANDIALVAKATMTERISVAGISYGTRIAMRFGAKYPAMVGRLILDGSVLASPSESDAESNQQLFDAYRELTLNPSGEEVRRLYSETAREILDRNPGNGNNVSIDDLLAALLWASRGSDTAGFLEALRQFALSNADPLKRMADSYFGRLPSGEYRNGSDVADLYQCADLSSSDRARPASSRYIPGYSEPLVNFGEELCTVELTKILNVSNFSTETRSVPSSLNILTSGYEVDPVAPRGATLRSSLVASGNVVRAVIVPGSGHGALFNGNSCVDSAASDFLLAAAESEVGPLPVVCPV